MNANDLTNDINDNLCVEVARARNSFYSDVRGLTVRESYYVYGNGMVVKSTLCDSRESVEILGEDAKITFYHYYPEVA